MYESAFSSWPTIESAVRRWHKIAHPRPSILSVPVPQPTPPSLAKPVSSFRQPRRTSRSAGRLVSFARSHHLWRTGRRNASASRRRNLCGVARSSSLTLLYARLVSFLLAPPWSATPSFFVSIAKRSAVCAKNWPSHPITGHAVRAAPMHRTDTTQLRRRCLVDWLENWRQVVLS